ncbi:putative WD repeat-containing protein 91 -like protein isoform X2 [Capsicum annuum]|nr:putative WD repeat-containing protein 91 -like protein isoform X2 [Capsicum annuum]
MHMVVLVFLEDNPKWQFCRPGSRDIGELGYASLTVWNMRTWKAMTVLPLGEDPPPVTSVCFNHNGKLLAAAATDGMIHMFGILVIDMSAGLQITGWPAHDSAISSVLFGSDETSIFTLGGHRFKPWKQPLEEMQGKAAYDTPCGGALPRTPRIESLSHYKQEMALDADGRKLLVTSNSLRAPIYQVRGHAYGMRTLPHSASITTVDWHPTSPIFLTGSADHSVRVTSMA